MTAIAASSRCIPMSCWASSITVRGHSRRDTRTRTALGLDTDLTAEDWHEGHRANTRRASRRRPASPSRRMSRSSCGARSAPSSQSWMSARAMTYRKLHGIPEDWGTAVSVQAMVFGNLGDTSATGVAFTRNPSTGEQGALWRIPGQCPGRGCRRRHPHAAEHHRGGAHRGRLQGAFARER